AASLGLETFEKLKVFFISPRRLQPTLSMVSDRDSAQFPASLGLETFEKLKVIRYFTTSFSASFRK
ncbi:MAG TPA: hypothetical protein VII11_10720, partial [Bacteroidota bacterium]